jgi:hypothetical protein
MPLQHLKRYWDHWVDCAEANGPFCFLDEDHALEPSRSVDQNSDIENEDSPTPAIDEGLPLPCECSTTDERINLLHALAPDSENGQTCHQIIKLLETLEVSDGFM